MQQEVSRIMFRMPSDVKDFIAREANHNFTSQNAEIVRSIRERMERVKAVAGESLQAEPATVPNNRALQGSASPTA